MVYEQVVKLLSKSGNENVSNNENISEQEKKAIALLK